MLKIRNSRFMVWLGLVTICAFVSMGIFSCTNFEKNTYASLYATGSIYDVGMKTLRSFQDAGKVPPEARAKVNAAAIIFRASYYSAVDAFKAWKLSNNNTELKNILQNLVFGLASNFTAWQSIVNTYLPGAIQGEIKFKPGVVKAKTERDIPELKTMKGSFPKKVDPATISVIVSVIGILVQYGLPELAALLENLKKESITLEEIDAMKNLVKDPATY